MQNSTVVFQLKITNKPAFLLRLPHPNAKPENVTCHFKRQALKLRLIILFREFVAYYVG